MLTPDSMTSEQILKELRHWQQNQQLATEFHWVIESLNYLNTQEEIARVGQLLNPLKYSEIIASCPQIKPLKIALTGNFVLQAIAPFLRYFHLRENIWVEPYFSDYAQYTYELLDPNSSLYYYQPDMTVFLLDEHVIFDELATPWHLKELEQALENKAQHLEKIITQYTHNSQSLLILNTIPLSINRLNQFIDYKSKAMFSAYWKEFNARLLKLSHQFKGLLVIDIEPFLPDSQGLSDDRLSQYTKMHLTESLLYHYAQEISKISRALKGQSKKCLVVDLDNTLWKGVLGDDGIEGIEMSDSLVGEAYHHFQKVIKQLAAQGVLLAINSKNDQKNVKNVLQNHPKMVLRESDFLQIYANWSPKSDNIQSIAKSLNLSPDSLVFVDDSEFERNLLRCKIPEVTVIEIEQDPATFARSLLSGGWFNILEITQEDYSRNLKYSDEIKRQNFLTEFDSIEDYLKQLELEVELFTPGKSELARIAQLTLRTNQFNMTTQRYQEAEISEILQQPFSTIVGIHARDKFGDNGIIGAFFLHLDSENKNTLYLDNFLLSCRVFSRGIEILSLENILEQSKQTGIEKIYAEYCATLKNQKVRYFYKQHGFKIVEETENRILYAHFLESIPQSINHIKLQANYGGFYSWRL
ncbi:MAG: HAD-IIIC family phosphatase [Microcystis wesenbergii Mw_QC_B_20070930_S4]|jgi:FkbH-like protein|nr:MAG: HAD-IIIC family phosphatase [Microcystis wesenbergii Mw_QC_B_20070930_S4D]TRV15806.1 MAG: HAD-IIIC family phosphatase [Microcystis wesenbergii Mw_QC_B_20070930_S4]